MFVKIYLMIAISASMAAASPVGASYRPVDEPPRLSDTLAVAKSPFEPITLAQVADPNARNESPATVSLQATKTHEEQHIQTTRSTQSLVEQEKDTTPTKEALDDQTTTSESSPSPIGGAESSTPLEATTTQTDVGTGSGAGVETEAASTVSKDEPEVTSTTPSPATDISLSTTTLASTEAASAITTTTEASSEEPTAATKSASLESTAGSTEAPSTGNAETLAPAVEAAPVATDAPTTTTAVESAEPTDAIKPAEEQAKPAEKEEAMPAVEAGPTPATSSGAETSTTTTAPLESSTTTTTPEPTEASTIVATTTTTTTTTSPAKPAAEPEAKQEESKQQSASCNHLPTYEAEEVQKVFREETTFRNGTIKGKFTYINFDQRYRLVHYTRLPYGPVKIDLVEELGRPEQASNSSTRPMATAPSSASEVPNAVLQLRNILPNSLFGFPFVAPNSVANKPLDQRDGAAPSGSSFYSTEPISTPNLLSPSVPVSVLSGRRESEPASSSASAQDTLSQNLNDNIALSAISPAAASIVGHQASKPIQPSGATWENLQPVGVPVANNPLFQYALATQANHLEHAKQFQHNSGPAYTYLSNQAAAQYQYSPLPLYTFQQPSYFSAHHHSPPVQTATVGLATPPNTRPAPLVSHQPHDHEHYIAPFMLSQTPSSELQNEQPARLKLRVKSAKSLNPNAGIKSAQLRTQEESSQQHQQYRSSPIQAYRQSTNSQGRHRAGKQNQDLRPTINSTPVVYHVLRSPMGRVYSLPQYRNFHDLTYDLDDRK